MSKYILKDNGPLQGEIEINGAKNSVLGLIAASILCDDVIELKNVPNVSDVKNLLEGLKSLGSKIDFNTKTHILSIDNRNINPDIMLDFDFIRKIRASYYLLGALLGKYHKAIVSLPGGCNIGTRPMDLHFKGFEALGANLLLDNGNIIATTNKLVGTKIYLDFASVGATINILLASVLAKGTTILFNAAKEPHVVDIINFLNAMGANITIFEDKIVIQGVKKLHTTSYKVMFDQIEAGTFLLASAITKGNITIEKINAKDMECITLKLQEMGCKINNYNDAINIDCNFKDFYLKPTNIITNPYPGFPTDMQPQFAITLGLANGLSVINETIFENRYIYTDEISRMGGKMIVHGNTNIITGVSNYIGARVVSPDLRAGAALTLAGLTTKNNTIIENIHLIKRGYENFDEKLRLLGANIQEIA